MARSTTTGPSAATTTWNPPLTPATPVALTAARFHVGTPTTVATEVPVSSRKVTVAVTATGPGFATSTYVSSPETVPSATVHCGAAVGLRIPLVPTD
jgi:hypothetical protein